MIPDKKLVWLVMESTLNWLKNNQHEWNNTKMIFELDTNGFQTTLHFIHEGLVPEKESYAMCSEGWTTVINDYLFRLITLGEPHFK